MVKFGEVVDQPPELFNYPKLKNRIISGKNPTIPTRTPSGITEKDRNDVIQRYRIMKKQGKMN